MKKAMTQTEESAAETLKTLQMRAKKVGDMANWYATMESFGKETKGLNGELVARGRRIVQNEIAIIEKYIELKDMNHPELKKLRDRAETELNEFKKFVEKNYGKKYEDFFDSRNVTPTQEDRDIAVKEVAKDKKDAADEGKPKQWTAREEQQEIADRAEQRARRNLLKSDDGKTKSELLTQLFGHDGQLNAAEALVMGHLLITDREVGQSERGLSAEHFRMFLENLHENMVGLAMGGGKTYPLALMFGMRALMAQPGEVVVGILVTSNSQENGKYTKQGRYRELMEAMGIGVKNVFDGSKMYEAGKNDQFKQMETALNAEGHRVIVMDKEALGHTVRELKSPLRNDLRLAWLKITDFGVDGGDVMALMRQSFNIGMPKEASASLLQDVTNLYMRMADKGLTYRSLETFDQNAKEYAYTIKDGTPVFTHLMREELTRVRSSDGFYTAGQIEDILRGLHEIFINENVVVKDGESNKSSLEGYSHGTKDQKDYYTIATILGQRVRELQVEKQNTANSSEQGDVFMDVNRDKNGKLEAAVLSKINTTDIEAFNSKKIMLTANGQEATVGEAFMRSGKRVRVFGASGTFDGVEEGAVSIYGIGMVIPIREGDFDDEGAVRVVDRFTGESKLVIQKLFGFNAQITYGKADGQFYVRAYDAETKTYGKEIPMQDYITQRGRDAVMAGRGFLSIYEAIDSLRTALHATVQDTVERNIGDETMQAELQARLDDIMDESKVEGRVGRRDISVAEAKKGDSYMDRVDKAIDDLIAKHEGLLSQDRSNTTLHENVNDLRELKEALSRIQVIDQFSDPAERDKIAERTTSDRLKVFATEVAGRALNFREEVNGVIFRPGKYGRGGLLQILGREGRTLNDGETRADTTRDMLIDVHEIADNAERFGHMNEFLRKQRDTNPLRTTSPG